MFPSRTKVPLYARVLKWLWPSLGMSRLTSYWKHRLARMPGTPEAIAAGLACGVAASCTPFIGLHFILSMVLAKCMRANVLASLVGTIFGNPWTFPLIWYLTLVLGNTILGNPTTAVVPPEYQDKGTLELLEMLVFEEFHRILVPMVVGSVPLGVSAWVLAYFPLRSVIRRYRVRRAARRKRRS